MSVIAVYRDDGLRPGTPIVELGLSDDALLVRGAAEMDRHAQALNQIEMDVVYRPGLRLGQLIEASDPANPVPYRAKITGIEIAVSEALIETRLTLEQPR